MTSLHYSEQSNLVATSHPDGRIRWAKNIGNFTLDRGQDSNRDEDKDKYRVEEGGGEIDRWADDEIGEIKETGREMIW